LFEGFLGEILGLNHGGWGFVGLAGFRSDCGLTPSPSGAMERGWWVGQGMMIESWVYGLGGASRAKALHLHLETSRQREI